VTSHRIAFAAALLLSGAAFAQTPATTTTTPPATTAAPPTPAAPPQAAVPEMAPGAGMAKSSGGKVSAGDKKFVATIGSAGLSEVQEAQLAQQKGQDQKVKDFAQTMITDHTANNKQLADLAQQKGLTAPDSPDAKDQAEIDKLQKLDGKKFDRAYLKDEVRDHEKVLKLLQKEASDGTDPDIKAFAEQTIPVIQKHLDLAKTAKSSS
jgi:putative membrane protein